MREINRDLIEQGATALYARARVIASSGSCPIFLDLISHGSPSDRPKTSRESSLHSEIPRRPMPGMRVAPGYGKANPPSTFMTHSPQCQQQRKEI